MAKVRPPLSSSLSNNQHTLPPQKYYIKITAKHTWLLITSQTHRIEYRVEYNKGRIRNNNISYHIVFILMVWQLGTSSLGFYRHVNLKKHKT
jgi:hypothetical protein